MEIIDIKEVKDSKVITIDTECPFCHEHHRVSVMKEEYDKWKSGELIQRAFPTMRPETRELLITGICSSCWNDMEKEWDM